LGASCGAGASAFFSAFCSQPIISPNKTKKAARIMSNNVIPIDLFIRDLLLLNTNGSFCESTYKKKNKADF
jgi:hypothetical protein